MTVHDAARRLGISEDAVRMRVKRGKLPADKEGGRLYVMLDTEPTYEPTDRTNERVEELRERLEDLHEQVHYLRALLTEEQDARRRADTVIAQLSAANAEQARAIRAIEAPGREEPDVPPDTREYPETATPQPGRVGPQTEVEASQEASESPETPPAEPERVEPVEPVDPKREEPEPADPKRAEPERVEPEIPADEQQGRGPAPGAGGPQEGAEPRSWWRRVFGG
jgi:excisionase family DNA binding protein